MVKTVAKEAYVMFGGTVVVICFVAVYVGLLILKTFRNGGTRS